MGDEVVFYTTGLENDHPFVIIGYLPDTGDAVNANASSSLRRRHLR